MTNEKPIAAQLLRELCYLERVMQSGIQRSLPLAALSRGRGVLKIKRCRGKGEEKIKEKERTTEHTGA